MTDPVRTPDDIPAAPVTILVDRWAAARKVLAAALGVVAATAAGFGFLPLHAVFALAGQGWFAWADTAGLDTITLACIALLLTGHQTRPAWLLAGLSVPVQFAAINAPAHPWLATLVIPWPVVVMLLGCAAFVRNIHPFDTPQETR
jgi:hypothetical protein